VSFRCTGDARGVGWGTDLSPGTAPQTVSCQPQHPQQRPRGGNATQQDLAWEQITAKDLKKE